MSQVVITNPVLNSPFAAPERHFAFTDEGISNTVLSGRRKSSYFVPIAQSRRKDAQATFGDWTQERIELNPQINSVRAHVDSWRSSGSRAELTAVSRRLLDHWADPARDRPLFFCQIEALETIIFINEVAGRLGHHWIENDLRKYAADANPGLYRLATKMATGSGKTVVMAMLIAYHTLNKAANPQDARFTDSFLIVTPGITIRDRLRVLLPNDADNYYARLDLVPGHPLR